MHTASTVPQRASNPAEHRDLGHVAGASRYRTRSRRYARARALAWRLCYTWVQLDSHCTNPARTGCRQCGAGQCEKLRSAVCAPVDTGEVSEGGSTGLHALPPTFDRV
jgi:hypothetical protein